MIQGSLYVSNNISYVMMELDCPNVVKMTCQSEKTLFLFVVPNFDFVVVAARYEKRLSFVEIKSSNGALRIRDWIYLHVLQISRGGLLLGSHRG